MLSIIALFFCFLFFALCLMCLIVPQVTLQGLLYFEIIGNKKVTGIASTELLISICSACLNCTIQIMKLYLESNAIKQSFVEYSLIAVMGRIAWVPFLSQIEYLAQSKNKQLKNNNKDKRGKDKMIIDYDIKYNLPCITKWLGIKNSIEYDFSVTSIRFVCNLI